MRNPPRKLAFVLAATEHGTLILNRFDYRPPSEDGNAFGVGYQILETGTHDPAEVDRALLLLDLRRQYFGDGVVAVDCGANIGVHAIEWARRMSGWGSVLAIEAQERVYYALAGNIALNNCFNARALHAAVAAQDGRLQIPQPDYLQPSSFGSLELQQRPQNEFIGQPIDYSPGRMVAVSSLTLDALQLPRVDLIKFDVEGMEEEALHGAQDTIARHRPILMLEWVKSSRDALCSLLFAAGYAIFQFGMMLVAVHREDKSLGHIKPVLEVAI
jgi:FkbM family methyltransferase